ncbi:oligosaccharide 4-alpha-D-glucosyltransferase [Pedobacter sp. UYP30]|uniref:TIM-barrel domain-containing protein n=1 Tax=Pedobacter sp. UYP30 TaxID=1756400 RepID=UPI0033963149
MKKILFILLFGFGIVIPSIAQNTLSLGNFKSSSFNGKRLLVTTQNGNISILPYLDDVIQITYQQKTVQPVVSYSTIGAPQKVKASYRDKPKSVELKTADLSVVINKADLFIYFINKKGDTLSVAKNYDATDGKRKLDFTSTSKESFYGGGFRAIDLDKRGTVLENYNQAHGGYKFGAVDLNIAIPFLLSNRSYGLYFDNYAKSKFDVAKTEADQVTFNTTSGAMRFYFMSGSSMGSVMEHYTYLTGRQPLPPRWAMGYISSRYGYKSEKEAVNMVDQTQKAGIPLDGIVFDLYWYKSKAYMGNQNWALDSFPNPKLMLTKLLKKGIRVVPISETYITKKSENFDFAYKNNLFASDIYDPGKPYIFKNFWTGYPTGLLDIFKPAAQKFFWSQYRDRINEGLSGWWFDLGEPESVNDSLKFSLGKEQEVHNLYSLIWAKTEFDGYRKDFPNKRIFTMIRSGFAGMQRYSTFPWTGDVFRGFEGLKAQIPSMVNMGLSGVGYMHSDAGGFTSSPNINPELYSRWLEFAAFTPVMRTHASIRNFKYSPEPIFWDDTTKNRVVKYIKLRYQLLPYNYTMAYKNTTTGRPLMLPVNYFEQDNERLSNVNTEYLWGEHLLVAPVIAQGDTTKKVLFPKGQWIGFNDLKSYRDSAEVYAPIDSLPIFVKAGSIIPMSKEITNTDQYDGKNLILKYYGGDEGENVKSEWFYDNGSDPNSLKNGQYNLVSFTTNRKNGKDYISIKGNHLNALKTRFTLQVMGKRIKSVQFSSTTNYKIVGNSTIDFLWTGKPVSFTIRTF